MTTRHNKFGAQKIEMDGIIFPSILEGTCYKSLKFRERAGEIVNIRRQVPFPIFINGAKIFTYYADFVYTDCADGKDKILEAKGFKTPIYRLKKKAVEAYYCLKIIEWP